MSEEVSPLEVEHALSYLIDHESKDLEKLKAQHDKVKDAPALAESAARLGDQMRHKQALLTVFRGIRQMVHPLEAPVETHATEMTIDEVKAQVADEEKKKEDLKKRIAERKKRSAQ